MGSVRRGIAAAVLFAVFVIASGGAAARSSTSSGLPSKPEAEKIAGGLWTLREGLLARNTTDGLASIETGAALRADRAYVDAVLCGCTPMKGGHDLEHVVASVPPRSDRPAFLAQIQTVDVDTGKRVWFAAVVERAAAGWRLSTITNGGVGASAPMSRFSRAGRFRSAGASTQRRTGSIATATIARLRKVLPSTSRTSYGATIHTKLALGGLSGRDNVYGFALTNGQVLSCFTVHELDTYTLRGGLLQGASRRQWGASLAPGIYRSITSDIAETFCRVGSGRDRGQVVSSSDATIVGMKGVRE